MNTAFSVIIPMLNEAQTIVPTLESLVLSVHHFHSTIDSITTDCVISTVEHSCQERTVSVEIVLVDGGSTDCSVSIANEYLLKTLANDSLSISFFILNSAPGRARQMNAGAAQAQGEVLVFLHADTRVSLEFAAQLIQIQKVIQLQKMRAPCWGRFNVRLSGQDKRFRCIEWFMNHRSRLTGIATGDHAIFVHRDLFEKLGGFAEIDLMEDIEFCKRSKRVCAPLCLSTRITTSSRRWEKYGIHRTVLLMWRIRLAYFFGVEPARLVKWYGRSR